MITRRTGLRIAALTLAAALLAYGLLAPASRGPEQAPALPRLALRGGAVTLAALRGHPEAIAFFATWCDACHSEAPAIARFARSPAGRGRILAIDDTDPDPGKALGFIAHYAWRFPVLNDPDGVTADAYEVVHLPTTVLLNSKGEIVAREAGAQTVASLTQALAAAG